MAVQGPGRGSDHELYRAESLEVYNRPSRWQRFKTSVIGIIAWVGSLLLKCFCCCFKRSQEIGNEADQLLGRRLSHTSDSGSDVSERVGDVGAGFIEQPTIAIGKEAEIKALQNDIVVLMEESEVDDKASTIGLHIMAHMLDEGIDHVRNRMATGPTLRSGHAGNEVLKNIDLHMNNLKQSLDHLQVSNGNVEVITLMAAYNSIMSCWHKLDGKESDFSTMDWDMLISIEQRSQMLALVGVELSSIVHYLGEGSQLLGDGPSIVRYGLLKLMETIKPHIDLEVNNSGEMPVKAEEFIKLLRELKAKHGWEHVHCSSFDKGVEALIRTQYS